MAGRKVNRDPPGEGGTGHAQILQAGKEEIVHHLVLAGHRLDEFGVCIDVLDQAVCVFFHPEEISVLLGLVNGISADGASALFLDLGSRVECLALLTVHAAVMPQIDIALVVELFKDLLDLALMIGVRRADKTVVGRAHEVPEPPDLARDLVDELLGALPRASRAGLDLLAVLIRSRHKAHIETVRPFIARDAVRKDDLIAVSDVGLA